MEQFKIKYTIKSIFFRENGEINTIYPIACKPYMKNKGK